MLRLSSAICLLIASRCRREIEQYCDNTARKEKLIVRHITFRRVPIIYRQHTKFAEKYVNVCNNCYISNNIQLERYYKELADIDYRSDLHIKL